MWMFSEEGGVRLGGGRLLGPLDRGAVQPQYYWHDIASCDMRRRAATRGRSETPTISERNPGSSGAKAAVGWGALQGASVKPGESRASTRFSSSFF